MQAIPKESLSRDCLHQEHRELKALQCKEGTEKLMSAQGSEARAAGGQGLYKDFAKQVRRTSEEAGQYQEMRH